MPINLSGRPFLRLLDFSTEEIEYLLKLSKNFKDLKRTGTPHRYLEGKNIVLLFQKTSTRTRCAFEVGGMDLGMGVTYLDAGSSQMGKKESQMLADALTVQENFNYDIKGLKFVFFGDLKNNMGRSLMVMCAKLGMNFVGCAPKDCWMDEDLIKTCEGIAAENGCTVKCTEDVKEAATDADVIYTDVWVSMGEPDEVWQQRIEQLQPYRVTKEIMAMAKPTAIFLHCLPAFHDTNTTTGEDIAKRFGVTEMEVEDAVFESKQSKVFDEAENRMHTIKAVMYATLR